MSTTGTRAELSNLRTALEARASHGAKLAVAALRVGQRANVIRDLPGLLGLDVARAVTHGVNVRSLFELRAAVHPDRLALCDERSRLTYRQTNNRINQLAHALLDATGPGRHRVVLCMENRVEYIVAWMANFRLGWASVHASDSARGVELAYQLRHSGADVIIGTAKTSGAIRDAIEELGDEGPKLVLWVGGPPPEDARDAAPGAPKNVDFDDFIALASVAYPEARRLGSASENVVYTSGTTGRPKGAVRDFSKMGPGELIEILDRLPVGYHEQHLVVSKLYHSAGQVFSLMTSALGGTLHIRAKYDPAETLRLMHDEQITSMFFVPNMLRQLLDLPEEDFRRSPPFAFRWMVSGAAPFPHELRTRAIARFGASAVHDFYGASELGWVTLANGHEMLERPGTVGMPLMSQRLRVVSEAGEPLPTGEAGLIQVTNNLVMDGYLDNAEATEEATMSGWMTVEDTGYVDDDGYVFIAGRARDMVISGGVNLYPAEIEEVLLQHPAIREVAVIGVEDAKWGERVEAIIVPVDTRAVADEVALAEGLDAAALKAWTKELLAPYKIPKRWHLVPELPRNAVGKVLKNELRARYSEA